MISDNELQAVREYLQHLAINWWADQPESRTVATCDACGGRPVARDGGYLIGSSLWCEDCYFEKKVEDQIKQNPNSLGPGVFQNALDMFGKEHHRQQQPDSPSPEGQIDVVAVDRTEAMKAIMALSNLVATARGVGQLKESTAKLEETTRGLVGQLQDLARAEAGLGQGGVCQKCGEREGWPAYFYYGHTEEVSREWISFKKQKITTLTQVRGMNVALVCERCTTKHRWKETLKYTAFTLGLGIAGLILTAVGCTPGILLALAGLLTPLAFLVFAARNRQVLAEEIAIAIRKPHLEQGDINAFWTTEDVETQFHIPRPETPAWRPAPVRGKNLLWPAAILGIGVALLLVAMIIAITSPDLDPGPETRISDPNANILAITTLASPPMCIGGFIWLVVLMIRMRKAKAS